MGFYFTCVFSLHCVHK